ncbi:MAG: hypothetical protein HYX92_00825 [Chloroflexi bacterium]|nr:hypothetical protein [Chloroflexota bacterium]
MPIVGSTFVRTAHLVASGAGVAGLGVAEYPGAILLHTAEEIRDNLEKVVFDRIIAGLTAPATVATQRVGTARDPEEIVFAGDFDEVNEFFLRNRWTDGMAIAPPTLAKVREYLGYTDRSPDEEIAILPQANLRATPRNIAVNAVMAGCRPVFMPLLIAAVEAIGEPDYQLMSLGSTGCKTPWLLVNGPIVKKLGIEYGIGLRSRGPNPAIGRAFGLIINNIAGFRPGDTLMGTWGYYLPFVLAEDEDACDEIGWDPYHVEHGFSRNTSTVTARTTVYWGGQGTPKGDVAPTAEQLLQVIYQHLDRQTITDFSLRYGARNQVAVLITPCTAKVLAAGGYSKRDVANHAWENTRTTVERVNGCLQGYTGAGVTIHDLVEMGTLPSSFDRKPEETIPIYRSADLIDVVVCGDAQKDKVMGLWCNYFRPVTKRIE